jgi:flagellar biosynthesis protein FliQ
VTDTDVTHLAMQTMVLATKLCAPILLTALAIGLLVSLFQSVTQIQEATLSFVPKMIGIGIVLLVCGNWMLGSLVSFTKQLFEALPQLLGTG